MQEPLYRASPTPESIDRLRRTLGDEVADEAATSDLWMNDQYQVCVRRTPGPPGAPDMVHLSIKRLDCEPVHDWRDLQEIKNQLLGPEIEAVELYPAESRLVDSANQYHLWALDTTEFRWPVGFQSRFVSGSQPPSGGKQRPIPESTH